MIHPGIINFNREMQETDKAVCDLLASIISQNLPDAEQKIWHKHPVWFLDNNPIVGYSKLKAGIRLMFWSGASFGEPLLKPGTGKFKDASILYSSVDEVDEKTYLAGYPNQEKYNGITPIFINVKESF